MLLTNCYFQYDQYKTPMENIGLQDSLLSRFDLLFIVLDKMDPDSDRNISTHVLKIHRYRSPDEQDGAGGWRDVTASLGSRCVIILFVCLFVLALALRTAADLLATSNPDEDEDNSELVVWEKFDSALHNSRRKR